MSVRVQIDPQRPDPAVLADAARALTSGGLIAFPTESFYGLGVLGSMPAAVGRLFAVKRRPAAHPILMVAADRAQVATVIERISPTAERLMEHFWPGPLTLVLPARSTVSPALTGGTGRLGVRIPGLELTRQLAAAAGAPVTATSANISGASPPMTADGVESMLGAAIDLILDGGPTVGGLPSTVLDLCEEAPLLVREGKISIGQLQAVCGETVRRTKT